MVNLQKSEATALVDLVSIPRATINDQGRYVINIANNQGNKVFISPQYTGKGSCYVDLDINEDSNYDGKPDNDKDMLCNTPKFVEIADYAAEINGRIIYEDGDGKLVGNGIVFAFTEQTIAMTQSQKMSYNKIISLMKTLPSSNDDQKYIKSLLQEMADNVRLGKSQTETIINMRVYLENTKA